MENLNLGKKVFIIATFIYTFIFMLVAESIDLTTLTAMFVVLLFLVFINIKYIFKTN